MVFLTEYSYLYCVWGMEEGKGDACRVVLLGGGHTNVEVARLLCLWRDNPTHKIQHILVTLVSDGICSYCLCIFPCVVTCVCVHVRVCLFACVHCSKHANPPHPLPFLRRTPPPSPSPQYRGTIV